MTTTLVRTGYKMLALFVLTSAVSAQTLEHSQDPALVSKATSETEVLPIKFTAPEMTDFKAPSTQPQSDDDISSASWPFNSEVSAAEASNTPKKTDITPSEALPEVKVTESDTGHAFSIKDVEQVIEGMLSKKKITGALVGTTISAALSAHPVGAFFGGLIGAMVGKESKYKPAIEAASITEQDLFAALDKLAEERTAENVQQPETPSVDPVAASSEAKPQIMEVSALSAIPEEPSDRPHNDCYRSNNSGPRDRAAMKHCFYYAY